LKSPRPRILSIGGGTGLSTLLRGLKNGPADLAAIVTVTDDGGSSGRLREELNVMPPGDIRNCMIALSEDELLMSRLFRFRFNSNGDLNGHSFGNLFLTALAGVTGDFAEAVRLTSEVLAIKGRIYPSTNSQVSLRGQLNDGSWIDGETKITASGKKIKRICLEPEDARPLDAVLKAIEVADIITLGPGSLYTSLIPNLLVKGIAEAVKKSSALKIYVQNIMTQPGESDGMSVGDHVEALVNHCSGQLLFSKVLLNSGMPSPHLLSKYEAEGAAFVKIDRDRLAAMGLDWVERDMLSTDDVIRHDPHRLAEVIYEMVTV
jgi:uncharacterized cofD-like protein